MHRAPTQNLTQLVDQISPLTHWKFASGRLWITDAVYSSISKLACSVAVESPPTQTSNTAGSSTHVFSAGLQYVSSSLPNMKWSVFFSPGANETFSNPLSWRTGRDALPDC